ncbi:hypothetical protein DPMN_155694 [Dreissena polymorpha]|uniref:Uncharacterized protein n=1 Tax=Dreissena polymorpha TaxID=45954 RepID=A0A9D4FND0_DREPO|nr:hypothetical protein DPMN_155694 [Dreissena polymorpha]
MSADRIQYHVSNFVKCLVLTRLYYSHIKKNARPPGSHEHVKAACGIKGNCNTSQWAQFAQLVEQLGSRLGFRMRSRIGVQVGVQGSASRHVTASSRHLGSRLGSRQASSRHADGVHVGSRLGSRVQLAGMHVKASSRHVTGACIGVQVGSRVQLAASRHIFRAYISVGSRVQLAASRHLAGMQLDSRDSASGHQASSGHMSRQAGTPFIRAYQRPLGLQPVTGLDISSLPVDTLITEVHC